MALRLKKYQQYNKLVKSKEYRQDDPIPSNCRDLNRDIYVGKINLELDQIVHNHLHNYRRDHTKDINTLHSTHISIILHPNVLYPPYKVLGINIDQGEDAIQFQQYNQEYLHKLRQWVHILQQLQIHQQHFVQ